MKLAFAWKLPEGNLTERSDDYRTSRPVTARPMIMRWISEVPSKIVKLSGMALADLRTCR
jgi:hypothetical protein